ncbi:MAG: hypothetical protein RLZZ562_1337 [Planctomycetota bacterium]
MLRLVVLPAFALACALHAQGPSTTPAPMLAIASKVDAFVSDTWSSDSPDGLVAALRAANVDAAALESMLRAGRPSYPDVAIEKGKLSARLPLQSEHLDHSTEHYVYVPKSYDAGKAHPLLVVGHGGSAARDLDFGARAARAGLKPFWLEAAERHGFLVVAPLSDRGWMQIGTSMLFSAIARMQRDFHVDPDRVFLTGHSMGGHLTWRSAFWFADRWAAVSPMSGGYDYVKSGDVFNLVNVRGFATCGEQEPYQIREFNETIAKWMGERRYPWSFAVVPGGHEIFPDEVARIAAAFVECRRDLYRKRVWARASGLRFEAAESNPQWDKKHMWTAGRPIDLSTAHWLRFCDLPDGTHPEKQLQKAFAEVKDGNRIELTCENVRRMRVLLHPRMVDFAAPVTIVANGKVAFEGAVQPELASMLRLVREFSDRGRVFWAAVEIQVEGDREVPEPRVD